MPANSDETQSFASHPVITRNAAGTWSFLQKELSSLPVSGASNLLEPPGRITKPLQITNAHSICH